MLADKTCTQLGSKPTVLLGRLIQLNGHRWILDMVVGDFFGIELQIHVWKPSTMEKSHGSHHHRDVKSSLGHSLGWIEMRTPH